MSEFKTVTVINYDEDDNEEEVEYDLPAKMEVCHDCEGYGTVLNESMRNHGYSSEEFAQEFDEEEAEHYFRRGGMYDVTCLTCKGRNVVQIIDREACSLDPKLKFVIERLDDDAKQARIDAQTDRMERMMGC